MASNRAYLEPLRSLAFGGISASYAPVGDPFDNPIRLICFTNNTQGDMIFSIDGVNDHLFIKSGSFKLFDITTNHRPAHQDDFVFAIGTRFFVKQSTAPVSGSVYIEVMYAQ